VSTVLGTNPLNLANALSQRTNPEIHYIPGRTDRGWTRHTSFIFHLVLLIGASSGGNRLPSCTAVIKLVRVAVERPASCVTMRQFDKFNCEILHSQIFLYLAVPNAWSTPEIVQSAGVGHVPEQSLAETTRSKSQNITRSEHFETEYFKMNGEAKDVTTTNIINQM
jgi:hypothetical protein